MTKLGIFFHKTGRGTFFFCIWRLSLTHITHQRPDIHLKFLTLSELGGLKKGYFDEFWNFKTTFRKNLNQIGKTDFTNVYHKVQRNKTGNYCSWVFFLLGSVISVDLSVDNHLYTIIGVYRSPLFSLQIF